MMVDENYKTLCSDHTDARGSISLKHLFSECGEITVKLLERIIGRSDIKAALENIIEVNIKEIRQTDWRYCLINYPEMFGLMASYYYRIRITSDKVLLVWNSRSSGFNYEAFTDALKKELEKRSIYLLYDSQVYKGKSIGKTTDGEYFVIYSGAHNKRYIIKYIKPCFVISDIKGAELFRSKTAFPITETADYLEKNLK